MIDYPHWLTISIWAVDAVVAAVYVWMRIRL